MDPKTRVCMSSQNVLETVMEIYVEIQPVASFRIYDSLGQFVLAFFFFSADSPIYLYFAQTHLNQYELIGRGRCKRNLYQQTHSIAKEAIAHHPVCLIKRSLAEQREALAVLSCFTSSFYFKCQVHVNQYRHTIINAIPT